MGALGTGHGGQWVRSLGDDLQRCAWQWSFEQGGADLIPCASGVHPDRDGGPLPHEVRYRFQRWLLISVCDWLRVIGFGILWVSSAAGVGPV